QIMRAHVQLAQTTHRNAQRAGYRGWTELLHARITVVRDELNPGIVLADHAFDIRNRDIFIELDSQCLAVATHRADTHTNPVHRYWALEAAKNFVGFR